MNFKCVHFSSYILIGLVFIDEYNITGNGYKK